MCPLSSQKICSNLNIFIAYCLYRLSAIQREGRFRCVMTLCCTCIRAYYQVWLLGLVLNIVVAALLEVQHEASCSCTAKYLVLIFCILLSEIFPHQADSMPSMVRHSNAKKNQAVNVNLKPYLACHFPSKSACPGARGASQFQSRSFLDLDQDTERQVQGKAAIHLIPSDSLGKSSSDVHLGMATIYCWGISKRQSGKADRFIRSACKGKSVWPGSAIDVEHANLYFSSMEQINMAYWLACLMLTTITVSTRFSSRCVCTDIQVSFLVVWLLPRR